MNQVIETAVNVTAMEVAEELDITFNGVQEAVKGPNAYLWTDPRTGSTFATYSVSRGDVGLNLALLRQRFNEKPGMKQSASEIVQLFVVLAILCGVALWVGSVMGAW